jgi:hypothetical protein
MSGIGGTPQNFTFAATALGAASGLVIPLNNPTPAVLTSVLAAFVTGATVGNRNLYMAVRLGAVTLWFANPGAAQAASLTQNYLFGQGIPLVTPAAGISANYMPLPRLLAVPALASLVFIDNANIATTDTVAAQVQLTY